ncbi:hypothetical protein [Achromobacter piechaudii]|uniref:Uncharacterized protein n=1 Tax=Achromobacter piechaudii TaxID=72556 RepID=A0A6S7DVI9_9BURK|nr:hypothetical protein [Achromobacter piechaudii]CAB3687340.1 hypothetical protein LMG1873_01920 [Achromobacter piechaudii]CAB3865506.1 hypothetical protein LMG2828_02700 [Achromobacter piechaudii]CAB3871695.1 hypothetical protein LMG1861_02799 [Achromobacter piechaudii]CAB3948957.1 hypothetical protein LMG6103_02040 [Achromobacter piechaudii]
MNTIRSTQQQPEQPAANTAVAALQEENALLFKQLHIVQEELERVHHASGSHRTAAGGRVVLEDGRFPEVAADNLRYRAILDAQRTMHATGALDTTAAGLGEILIQGSTSVSAFVATPMRLLKVWRKEKKQKPPKKLGGQSFSEVIAAYEKGGAAAVDSLLASVSLSSTTHANALTAVARSQMHVDPAAAVEFARRACAIEPRPFRLKWLAFRMHEAGELVEAEALLETLPLDTKFSDSESRQAARLRNEAKQVRLREALQSTGYAERRGKVEQQIAALEQAHREQEGLAEQRGRDVEALRATQARLQQENSALTAQVAEQAGTIADLRRVTETLRTTQSQLQIEIRELRGQLAEQVGLNEELERAVQALESAAVDADKEMQELLEQCSEQTELAAGRGRAIAEMQMAMARAGQENLAVRKQFAEQAELATERGRAVASLQAANLQFEREKSVLIAQLSEQAEQAELADERGRAIADLQTAKAAWEQEKAGLLAQHAEHIALVTGSQDALEEIKAAKAQLKQENAALLVKHVEQFELAAERGRSMEALKAVQSALTEENARLQAQCAEQARIAEEQAPEIKVLQDQLQSRVTVEADLSARQQGMQEELVKAEAQLDLIKDMLFRGARL